MKTVLPAEASAKMDFRLVPDQRPRDVFDKVRAHLDAQGFDDVEIVLMGAVNPARTDIDSRGCNWSRRPRKRFTAASR